MTPTRWISTTIWCGFATSYEDLDQRWLTDYFERVSAFVRRNVGVRAELADGVRRTGRVAGRAMISSMSIRQPTAAAGLVVLLTGTGILHFAAPAPFDAIIPEQLPGTARAWTRLSGVAELVIAGLIAAPRTRQLGGLLAALLFVAVLPANVKMAIDWSDRPAWMRALAYGRLPLQIPLVMWAMFVYRRAAVTPGP